MQASRNLHTHGLMQGSKRRELAVFLTRMAA
jgi:hypothetical protein